MSEGCLKGFTLLRSLVERVASTAQKPQNNYTGDSRDPEDHRGCARASSPTAGTVEREPTWPREDEREGNDRVEQPHVDHRVEGIGP